MDPTNLGTRPVLARDFTPAEKLRYSRHLLMPEMGAIGQSKLRASTVLCVGAGGLGSPAILYLAAAGVGRIIICDGDTVDLSNLQRQVAHATPDIGVNKAESAAAAARDINPHIQVIAVPEHCDAGNLPALVAAADVVMDGSDNFPTRFLVNDACWFAGKPLVSASVFRFEGQLTTFLPSRNNPCYRCLFPRPPKSGAVPSCSEAGVLGTVVGMLGTMQATEVIKLLAGIGTPLESRLLQVDAFSMDMMIFGYPKNPGCPLCSAKPTITRLEAESGPICEI